jgi:hypothetical protein
VSSNLTIESPNFEKIKKESGQFTSDALALLWATENLTRKELRTGLRESQDILSPKVIQVSAAASVNDLDLQDASVIEFTGASAQNFTGMRAPETGKSRLVLVYISGAGTITARNAVTSQAGNQIFNLGAVDDTLAQGSASAYLYLSGYWRQIF